MASRPQTSHMLKTNKRGSPWCKDLHDLFSTLVVSLNLKENTRLFRSYPNSFTTEDAAVNLANLRFSQSNRAPDPNDATRVITTTTTTTFTMSRDIAKGICQHFMDARLIENALDLDSPVFKERGIYQLTPKGLHVLERFIAKNGIGADHLVKVFSSQPIVLKLLNLERRATDDELVTTRAIVETVFKRFAGNRQPNYVTDAGEVARSSQARAFVENAKPPNNFDRGSGIELQDIMEKNKNGGSPTLLKHVFGSVPAIDWLLDFSTCCCREEAGEVLAFFVAYGFIAFHHDRTKSTDRSGSGGASSTGNVQGASDAEYKWGPKITYRITDEGRKLLNWDNLAVSSPAVKSAPNALRSSEQRSRISIEDDASSQKSGQDWSVAGTNLNAAMDSQLLMNKSAFRDLFKSDVDDTWAKEQQSSSTRLKVILDSSLLRALFREFLRTSYCEENLGFYIEVADFKRRFYTTSSASAAPAPTSSTSKKPMKKQGMASNAMESHQNDLNVTVISIYRTYLCPGSPSELNIEHSMRNEVVTFIKRCCDEVGLVPPAPKPLLMASPIAPSPQVAKEDDKDIPVLPLRATQVQTLLRYYERIQDHVYRLLATDQVPKFIRTKEFMQLLDNPEE